MTSQTPADTHGSDAGQSEADLHVTDASSQIGIDTQTFSAGHFKHVTHAPFASSAGSPTPFGLGHSTVLGRVRRANPGRPTT